jgi:hypothetical protein
MDYPRDSGGIEPLEAIALSADEEAKPKRFKCEPE